jgi:dihydropteroate synthase
VHRNDLIEMWAPAWGKRTFVMGVINATPDSFSGDGLYKATASIATRAAEMVSDGADVLDIGGESTRPGYVPVELAEELDRVIPAVRAVAGRVRVPISIDTSKSHVAARALEAGASIVNDVSGLADGRLSHVVAKADAGIVVVHNRPIAPGSDVMTSVISELSQLVEAALAAGVAERSIIVDPGLGLGKAWRQNLEIIRRLHELHVLNRPILVGPSRKGTIGRVLGTEVQDRLEGSAALVAVSIAGGADMVRVHDVREMTRVARMTDVLARAQAGTPSDRGYA